MGDLTEFPHPLIIPMGLGVSRDWGWSTRTQLTFWQEEPMGSAKATLRVDRSGGGYLIRVRVKGATGALANGHVSGVAEKDIKDAIVALMAELVAAVSKTPA